MNYKADTEGNIFNSEGRLIKQQINNRGYLQFKMYLGDGQVRGVKSSRFVYEYFNGEIPEGHQIDHINGIKTDNRISNLQVVLPSKNIRKRPYNKLSEDKCAVIKNLLNNKVISTSKLAEMYDCNKSTVYYCWVGKTWS